jgi:hypothetical protein
MLKSAVVAAALALTPFAAWSDEVTSLASSTSAGVVVPVIPKLQAGCPTSLLQRTAAQVWADHLDALQNGDLDRAMCDYAENAKVIMPGFIASGPAEIRAGFLGFAQLVGGMIPTITTVTIAHEIVMSTFNLFAPNVSIPDGSDTFVVRFGLIQYQTVHASLVFNVPTP